jgi:hypothetical protein
MAAAFERKFIDRDELDELQFFFGSSSMIGCDGQVIGLHSEGWNKNDAR